MAKYSIIDSRWLGDAIGGFIFLTTTGVVLYVWATAMRPLPNRLVSEVGYCAVFCVLLALVVLICAKGFTFRWTEVDSDELILHKGFYGLFWKARVVPKSQISALERYDRSRQGLFTHIPASGIRVCLRDGSALILAESDGEGKYHEEVAQMRDTLGIPRNGRN